MTLSEVLDQLQQGELSFLKLGEFDTPESQKKITSHLNLALTELHTRFFLRKGSVDIEVVSGVSDYEIHSSRGKLWGKEVVRYLLDSPERPFPNNLLKIEAITNKGIRVEPLADGTFQICGDPCVDNTIDKPLPLNDYNLRNSFHELAFNVVRIPPDYDCPTFTVTYRANHNKITVSEETDPCKVQIDISRAFMEPLVLFVAHRAARSLNSDQLQEQTNFYQLYEQSLTRLMNLGHGINLSGTNLKLDCAGWV
jgi:hypothetical protein